MDDYLQLSKHPGFTQLLLQTKDNTHPNSIFSDHICRVNKWGTRKVKLIAITGRLHSSDKFMYILEPDEKKDNTFKVKMTIYLAYIKNLVLAKDNVTCFALFSTTE